MATWNGARYIAEQLDSLFAQTVQNFRLIVLDDGSSDSTLCIVEQYRARYPDRVVIRKNPNRQGPCRNFSLLTGESNAPYVAFCDQDDVWRPEKLELGISAMKAIEAEAGTETPILVFSDMAVVDERLNVIAPSLWKLGHINPAKASLGAVLAQNLVTGCTSMANRSLIQKARPIPNDAVMHDWWLALVAVVFGVVYPLYQSTVLYRQHAGNLVGAGTGWKNLGLLKRLRYDRNFKERIEGSRKQSESFARQYWAELTENQKSTLAVWSGSRTLPPLIRQFTLHRKGVRGTTWFNHLGFLVRV